MASNYCPTCGTWAVRNANFCWQCGHAIAAMGHRFESSIGNGSASSMAPPSAPMSAGPQTPMSEHILRIGTIALGASAGALFADLNPAWIGLGPVAYALAGPVGNWFIRFMGRVPKIEVNKDTATTLRIEHVTEDKKHWLLLDFPQGIELEHLQYIAQEVLDKKAPFSRPALCKPGSLTQGEFYKIRDFWLQHRYAYYKHPQAKQQGIALTERCRRLLKKSQKIVAAPALA